MNSTIKKNRFTQLISYLLSINKFMKTLYTGGSGIGDYYLSNSLEPRGFSHSQSGTASPHMQSFINSPLNYSSALMRKTTDSSLYDTAGNCYCSNYYCNTTNKPL